jgi:nucleoside-specific outer membrane channel protein Tsx
MKASRAKRARFALVLASAWVMGVMPAGAQEASAPAAGGFNASNVKVRYGWNFSEPGISEDVPKSIFTFENTRAWSWGSSFLFVDFLRSWSDADANAKEVYGEWYPSASLRKLSGNAPSQKLLRDASVTFGINGGVRSTGPAPFVVLPGFTFELNIPAFRFFSVGTFVYVDRGRFQGHSTGCVATTFQVTPSWSLPFSLGGADLLFNGFADFIGSHGDCTAQVLTQPALSVDLSRIWHKSGVLEAGVRWSYWHNKYGVDDVEDSVIMPMLIWNF